MILALDMARRTGWATSDGRSGVHDFGFVPDETMGSKLTRLRGWLDERFTGVELVAFEKALTHHRGGRQAEQALGMESVLYVWCHDHGVRAVPAHIGTLKKHATGSGNAGKPQMIGAARKRWPGRKFQDDNEVDAVWLLDYVLTIAASEDD